MIVNLVQDVKSCICCPNFRRNYAGGRGLVENYMCLATRKKLGDSNSRGALTRLRENVSTLCPFREDEVNQSPVRGR